MLWEGEESDVEESDSSDNEQEDYTTGENAERSADEVQGDAVRQAQTEQRKVKPEFQRKRRMDQRSPNEVKGSQAKKTAR